MRKIFYDRIILDKALVRITSTPFQYYAHKIDKTFVSCSYRFGTDVTCGHCVEDKLKRHHRWWVECVILFANSVPWGTDGYPMIMDFGTNLYETMKGYARNPIWGNPTQYAMNLNFQTGDVEPIAPKESLPLNIKDSLKNVKWNLELDHIKADDDFIITIDDEVAGFNVFKVYL